MKKKSIFFFLSALILVASISAPNVIYASLPKVTYIKAQLQNSKKTITASGKIESTIENIQTADSSYVISKILVKTGDLITEGEKILKIDLEETNKIYLEKGIEYLGQEYITSNYTGTVNNIYTNEKMITSENSQLLSIIDTNSLCANINISEDAFQKIKIGQKVTITGSALGEKSYSGKISNIAAIATQNNNSTSTITATVKLSNPNKDLKPGFNIKARILLKNINNALIIPLECINQDEKGEFVYKLYENKAKKTYIKTDEITQNGAVIKSGIQVGDYLVSNPNNINKNISDVAVEGSKDD